MTHAVRVMGGGPACSYVGVGTGECSSCVIKMMPHTHCCGAEFYLQSAAESMTLKSSSIDALASLT